MKKGDLIIFGIIIISIIGVYSFNSRQSEDDILIVEVRIDGEIVDRFNVNEEIDKDYETEFGENHLHIHDGIVSVTYADCRDQICVNTKDATQAREAIVCVPNRFTVEIIGEGGDIDVISQ
jgi:hypothetical protein